MCDHAKKLIAWLDGELLGEESASVEEHVRACAQCRRQLTRFKKISRKLDTYCDASLAAKAKRGSPTGTTAAAVSAGVAAAAIAAAFLLFPRQPARKPIAELPGPLALALGGSLARPVATAAVATVPAEIPIPMPARQRQAKRNRPRRVPSLEPVLGPTVPQQAQASSWRPPEGTIEVAIPADALFAPGAVPEGVAFIADISIEPDGAVGQFRFGP